MNRSCAECSLPCLEIYVNCSIACLLKIDSNLGTYIHIHIKAVYLKHEKWSHLSLFPTLCVCVVYVCTKRWRSSGGKDDLFALKVHSLRCLLWRLSCIYSERSLFVHRILTRGAEVWTIFLSLSFYWSPKRSSRVVSFFFVVAVACLLIHQP